MSKVQLFISDLHLEAGRPDITRTLLQFLADNSGKCSDLFILGDLFEVWIGDDEPSSLAEAVATALHQFSAAGTKVYLMHGNRDFLLGEEYARRSGASLIYEPCKIETPSGPLLLLHGDSLCTDDVDYQRFRALVRTSEWQREFLSRSLTERRAFAALARQQSRTATAQKAMDIMDVNQESVLDLLREYPHIRLLHGHTHRPQAHAIEPESGNRTTRFVLGSWEQQAWYAVSDHAGISLKQMPLLTV